MTTADKEKLNIAQAVVRLKLYAALDADAMYSGICPIYRCSGAELARRLEVDRHTLADAYLDLMKNVRVTRNSAQLPYTS